jgi:hypothetical protein
LVEGVHEKPMEPGVETLRILQLGKLAPRQQERLLDGSLARSTSRRIRYAMA